MPQDLQSPIRIHLLTLLRGGQAHLTLDSAVENFPPAFHGHQPFGFPYSAWQLLEHIRIAQRDILHFSLDGRHQSPPWPEGYWPKSSAPLDPAAWELTLQSIRDDLHAFTTLIEDPDRDLLQPIPHAPEQQTLLREALLLADHNSYHLGQIVLLGKLLPNLPPSPAPASETKQ